MIDKDLSTPEAIFTVPKDLMEIDRSDAIVHLMDRIKGTIMTTSQLMASDAELPRRSVRNCLLGVYGQLDILEKLLNYSDSETTRDKLR